MKIFYFLLIINYLSLLGIKDLNADPSETKIKTLYNSLDPYSISQHLAFYEIYQAYPLGQQALQHAWQLLAGPEHDKKMAFSSVYLSNQVVNALITLVNKPINQEMIVLDPAIIKDLQYLSKRLSHFSLKGHHAWTEEEVLALPIEEIDLARGLFISQFGSDRQSIQTYEILIDLMTLQIMAHLPQKATVKEKIIAINAFIFDEMGFRFPPHSLYAQDIDLYTFLPSVLDSRRGVCLGVSILYMCIAQRLNLPLEMITPPGHIYVRYSSPELLINIETTARGVHLDSEEYLSMNTHSLQKRSIREVIGMAHFNQASVHWQNGHYEKALHSYQKAEPYMKEDPLLKELMGYTLLLTHQRKEGEDLLKQIQNFKPDYALVKNNMAEDYFQGNIDAQGIGVIFSRVDENRPSILAKKEALEKTLTQFPKFRAGILSLAVTWLQLHRMGEALEILKQYHYLDTKEPEIQYYLAVLNMQRKDFNQAWVHLHQAEAIVKMHQYAPKALKELRRELISCCPE